MKDRANHVSFPMQIQCQRHKRNTGEKNKEKNIEIRQLIIAACEDHQEKKNDPLYTCHFMYLTNLTNTDLQPSFENRAISSITVHRKTSYHLLQAALFASSQGSSSHSLTKQPPIFHSGFHSIPLAATLPEGLKQIIHETFIKESKRLKHNYDSSRHHGYRKRRKPFLFLLLFMTK